MPVSIKRYLAVFFFFSGFCGLLYQIIWIRLAFASFGIVISTLSVVISIFMLGLAVGSWAGGRLLSRFRAKTGLSALVLYAAAEIVIGAGAWTAPGLFDLGETVLLPLGETGDLEYLFLSGLIISIALFPWCVAMGLTFPFVMGFIRELQPETKTSFSFLYLANTVGAMFGALLTALLFIEAFGFSATLHMASLINFLIGGLSFQLSKKYPLEGSPRTSDAQKYESDPGAAGTLRVKFPRLILFTAGFVSLAMEVTWTRAFATVLGNKIYSFSMLLTTYLLATLSGSTWYRRHLKKDKQVSPSFLLGLCFVFSFLPVVMNDPRYSNSPIGALLSIFPFCAILGYLTPKLIDEYSKGNPDGAGRTYAVNIIGSILGPLFAGYFLIPAFGVRITLVILAAPFGVFYWMQLKENPLKPALNWALVSCGFAAAVCASFINTSHENPIFYKGESLVLRDHSATVIAFGNGREKKLWVNGKNMTGLTPITKVMGHLPLAIRETKPEAALAIALGMGTTLRSLASWRISVTAVELVPSVKQAFPFFFADAEKLLQKANVRVVIDDGRRFLKRTNKRYDVITVDPPPPVESAGSSLLYSKEFYQTALSRLKPDGIFHHWFPSGEKRIRSAIARSLVEIFPYIRSYHSIEGWGIHFLASATPFETPTIEQMIDRLPDSAKADLMEWSAQLSLREMVEKILSDEFPIGELLDAQNERIFISDDRPYNEYFLARRFLRHASLWISNNFKK